MSSLENFSAQDTTAAATDAALRNDAITFPPGTLSPADTLQQYFVKSDSAYKQLVTQATQSYDHIAKGTGSDNKLMSQYMSAVSSKVNLQLAKQDWNAYGNAHDGKTLDKEATQQLTQFRKEEPAEEKQANDRLVKLRAQVISTAQKNGVKDIDDKYLQHFEKTYFNEDKRSQELRTQLATKGANCTEASTAAPAATTSGEAAAVIPPVRTHHFHGEHHGMHHREHGAAANQGDLSETLNRQELARVQGKAEVQAQPQAAAPAASAEVTPIVPGAPAPDVWRSHLAEWEVKNFGREYYANVTDDKQRYQLDEAWYASHYGNRTAQSNVAGAYPYNNYNTGAYPYNNYYNTGTAYGYPNMYSPYSSFGLGNIGLSFGFGRPWGYNPWAYRPPMFYRPRGLSIIL